MFIFVCFKNNNLSREENQEKKENSKYRAFKTSTPSWKNLEKKTCRKERNVVTNFHQNFT